jgi:NAD(P)-dependent dehydrogenase (short-subunit alcohol dehydrogenase family)
LDKIKKSSPSRIINVSSLAHTRGKINFDDLNSANDYDPGAAYNQSKLANILFTKELSKKLDGKFCDCFYFVLFHQYMAY